MANEVDPKQAKCLKIAGTGEPNVEQNDVNITKTQRHLAVEPRSRLISVMNQHHLLCINTLAWLTAIAGLKSSW